MIQTNSQNFVNRNFQTNRCHIIENIAAEIGNNLSSAMALSLNITEIHMAVSVMVLSPNITEIHMAVSVMLLSPNITDIHKAVSLYIYMYIYISTVFF